MIEKILIDYISENMNIPVFMEEQIDVSCPYIVLEKTGGSESNRLQTGTFAIQCYGNTKYESASLNAKLKTKMIEITSVDNIFKCQLNSDYDYTDTQKKKYRYQAVYNITYMDFDTYE